MATFEELRKKRLQESQQTQQTSMTFEEAISRRKIASGDQTAFAEAPKPVVPVVEEESTAGEAFKRTAAVNVLPTLAGIGATATTMAVAGSVVPGLGTAVGFVAGLGVGIGSAIITKQAQDKVLEVTQGEEWKRNFGQQLAEDRKSHPYVTLIAETAPQLITFKPSPTTLKQAFGFGKRILTDPKSLSNHIKTLEGKTELNALINVGIGSGVNASLETYQQAREGDINALRILGSAVLGGVISDPNRLGVKLGFSPTGDAVIEEYNQFGSKTPAAKIITENNIPIIDRSADGLFTDRQELTAILKGQGEANRFTEPRILQAERISGTIDKDVTPDSDLNVYRLDGRSGPMRIGERVTANPHIADVFGGRVNPEATVKAGDLVRTSKGDYVYVPKSEISEQPKLPPVTAAVTKEVRAEVKTKERNAIKETKAKEAEAKRLAEEPARLQREAEALAVKERVRAEKAYANELKQAEIAKVKLTQEAEKVRKETMKRVIQEKKRVETEKTTLSKNLDKEIESVTVKLRKDISAVILDHNKRLAKATTKLQKSKEQIRFTNKKAALTAKAIKDKKALREKTASAIKNIKNDIPNIKKQSDETIKELQAKAKSIPKPELKKIEPVVRPDFAKPAQKYKKIQENTENSSIPTKSEPVVKTTTIGTKVVKSESLIKNAIKEAEDTSKKAQELDVDVTDQMGTTFVEQRKLSAELVAEKGFDDALKFAIDASDAEVRTLNLDRSSLYETLYKIAIKEGQFSKYRDELEQLALLTSDEVSVAAQKTSLARLATENDPFRRVVALKKALLANEKDKRGSVFQKEVDALYAKIKAAGNEADLNKIINDNLC